MEMNQFQSQIKESKENVPTDDFHLVVVFFVLLNRKRRCGLPRTVRPTPQLTQVEPLLPNFLVAEQLVKLFHDLRRQLGPLQRGNLHVFLDLKRFEERFDGRCRGGRCANRGRRGGAFGFLEEVDESLGLLFLLLTPGFFLLALLFLFFAFLLFSFSTKKLN
jgi:hypothetical protein